MMHSAKHKRRALIGDVALFVERERVLLLGGVEVDRPLEKC
jgi:hypothetical protein